MFDYRLKVFYTVATKLNFTKAASELHISQPAVTKHIHELELHFQINLFERSRNRKISLSPAGQILLDHVNSLRQVYSQINSDLGVLSQKYSGILKIGASTTISQYVLPSFLARFHKRHPAIEVQLTTGNTEVIERDLTAGIIDLGITEGLLKNASFHYTRFLNDRIVLVSNARNSLIKGDALKVDHLKDLTFLLRERGSGTLEVIESELKKLKLNINNLKMEMQLGSTEGIKSYLKESDSLAFLSIHSVKNELFTNELKELSLKGLKIERDFFFIELHGTSDRLNRLFINFCLNLI